MSTENNFNEELTNKLCDEIYDEFYRASKLFLPFNNEHEGYAIILEELDELWSAIKLNQLTIGRTIKCHKECVQVAAMALRFLHDMELNKLKCQRWD